jgi:hypothetical protein
VIVNGAGNTLETRIITEIRAGNVVADLFSAETMKAREQRKE